MINKKVYKDTWAMMDACNASGVIHTLSKVITPTVWDEIHNGDYKGEFNTHPLIVITVDKLMQLAGHGDKNTESYRKVLDVSLED